MKKKLSTKVKSKVFWTELVLLIAYALRLFEVYEMPSEILTLVQDIITALFTVFATLNNPDNRKEF